MRSRFALVVRNWRQDNGGTFMYSFRLMPAVELSLADAASVLRRGGVLVYPTEAVWGLGCDPFNEAAVRRVLEIKQRPMAKGMIVIAATFEQLRPHLAWDQLPQLRREAILASWPGPNTWLIPCHHEVPAWLRGDHGTLAVRVTGHPVAAGICRQFDGPVVSTSANPAGQPPAHDFAAVDETLLAGVDGWVAGETQGRRLPSTIRDGRTGEVVRPG